MNCKLSSQYRVQLCLPAGEADRIPSTCSDRLLTRPSCEAVEKSATQSACLWKASGDCVVRPGNYADSCDAVNLEYKSAPDRKIHAVPP